MSGDRTPPFLAGRFATSAPVLISMSMVLWVGVELLGAEARVHVPQVVWLRYLFHLLFMFVCIAPVSGLGFVRTSRPWLQLARSLLMLMMPFSYWMGIHSARPRDVLGVFWSAPLLVVAFAPLVRDRSDVWGLAVAALGWLGALVFYRPAGGSLPDSLIWGFGMAASFSLYVVLTAVLDRTESLLTNLFWSAVGVFVALSFFLPAFWRPLGAESLWALAGVGVLGWFTLATLDLALRQEAPSRLAALLLIQPLCHVLLEVVVGRRPLRPLEIVGSLLIAGAIGLSLQHRHAFRKRDARLG